MAMNQQRAQRMVDLVSIGEIDILERIYNVEHSPDVDVESGGAQGLAESEKLVQETRLPHPGPQRADFARWGGYA